MLAAVSGGNDEMDMRRVHWRRGPGTPLLENLGEARVWTCFRCKWLVTGVTGVTGGVCRDATASHHWTQ